MKITNVDISDRIFQFQWFAARIFNAAYIVFISFFLTASLYSNTPIFYVAYNLLARPNLCEVCSSESNGDLIFVLTFVIVATIGSLTMGVIECICLLLLKRPVISKKTIIRILASFISPAILYPFIFILVVVLSDLGHSFVEADLRTLLPHLTSTDFSNLQMLIEGVLNTLLLSALFFMFILCSAIPLWASRFLNLDFEPQKEGKDIFRIYWKTLNWQEIGSYGLIFITVAFVVMFLLKLASESFLNEVFSNITSGL